MAVYSVQSARAIANVIIPRGLPASSRFSGGRSHFVVPEAPKISSYYEVLPSADCPLACVPHSVAKLGRGQKRADYLLFKQAVNLLLNCKARSSIGGIKNIISIRRQ